MFEAKPKLSPAIIGIAIICLCLPFANVTCQGHKVAGFTGIQLVFGTTIEDPNGFRQKRSGKYGMSLLALLALLFTIIGMALSFYKHENSASQFF